MQWDCREWILNPRVEGCDRGRGRDILKEDDEPESKVLRDQQNETRESQPFLGSCK